MAESSLLDYLLGFVQVDGAEKLAAHLQHSPGATDRLDDATALLDRVGQRFFQVDILTRL